MQYSKEKRGPSQARETRNGKVSMKEEVRVYGPIYSHRYPTLASLDDLPATTCPTESASTAAWKVQP